MLGSTRSILRFPLVAFAFVVDRLRAIPGAKWIERHAPLVVSALLIAALVALSVWMAQRSPQRLTMAELAGGKLSRMQSWIIVSGELRAEPMTTAQRRYTLTDPAAPNAILTVHSPVELGVGHATVSGNLIGVGSGALDDFGWIGQLRADAVLAREPDPPWIAIGLGAAALFIGVAGRTSYPLFFRHGLPAREAESMVMPVGVRREWPPSVGHVVPGTVVSQPGAPVELRVGNETQQLRLHSAHSSVEAGELRTLFDSEPALVLRPSSGDLTITFASTDDRDAAFAALLADLRTSARSVAIS